MLLVREMMTRCCVAVERVRSVGHGSCDEHDESSCEICNRGVATGWYSTSTASHHRLFSISRHSISSHPIISDVLHCQCSHSCDARFKFSDDIRGQATYMGQSIYLVYPYTKLRRWPFLPVKHCAKSTEALPVSNRHNCYQIGCINKMWSLSEYHYSFSQQTSRIKQSNFKT